MEAIATRVEAIALGLEAIAIRVAEEGQRKGRVASTSKCFYFEMLPPPPTPLKKFKPKTGGLKEKVKNKIKPA